MKLKVNIWIPLSIAKYFCFQKMFSLGHGHYMSACEFSIQIEQLNLEMGANTPKHSFDISLSLSLCIICFWIFVIFIILSLFIFKYENNNQRLLNIGCSKISFRLLKDLWKNAVSFPHIGTLKTTFSTFS